MAKPPKFCPECREEYLHTATVCAECDVALVLEDDLGDGDEDDGEGGLPPVSELVCIRASAVGWAMALSERLSDAGIPHRVQAATDDDEGSRNQPGRNLPFGVFVLPDDEDLARRIDEEHMASEIPDLPDPDADGFGDDCCPACGEPVAADADECAGCGLALLSGE